MRSPVAWARGVRHPEAFHGHGVRHAFFEGWYIKLVTADRAQRWAVIPGIFRGLSDDQGTRDEAFVQVLDGLTGRSWYHRFEPSQFRASDDRFDVWVGDNHFSPTGVTLDLPQLKGRVDYTSPMIPWPVTPAAPGIMGWYGLVPFMECFHGIVSFGHSLAGTLDIEGSSVSLDGGRGYIEKDWGKAFPSGYIWMASNHIDTDTGEVDASLIASVAIIPWLGRAFRGSIIGFRHGGRLHRWTTYNGSKERLLTIDDARVRWKVEGPDGVLFLDAARVRGGLLHAPLRTAMHQRVEETLDARVTFRHESLDGRVLLEGVAECAGLEVFGDTDRLLAL
ncbi:tocopherol cyclase family protein [Microbacterium sp. C7(2022)]|uniref:tocopherol cyclase family protein n=1 Tax=Microbacterium sp. C7(2022) TaxID=2992759 RepID=UPI00237A4634|nr:tocopherol cyclase family protein [Microbacterium sp. C7(2022)]MDE0546252.1 tocopherol cyclase family protein [Microbacterium sp. C7(2022)]